MDEAEQVFPAAQQRTLHKARTKSRCFKIAAKSDTAGEAPRTQRGRAFLLFCARHQGHVNQSDVTVSTRNRQCNKETYIRTQFLHVRVNAVTGAEGWQQPRGGEAAPDVMPGWSLRDEQPGQERGSIQTRRPGRRDSWDTGTSVSAAAALSEAVGDEAPGSRT